MARAIPLLLGLLLLALGARPAGANLILTLGNPTPGFNDGDIVSVIAVVNAQAGQPAPFDQGYGSDPIPGANFSQSWTFGPYGPVTDIVAASISFGIVDDDSGSPGNQLAAFGVDGNNLTSDLNALMTSGQSGQYKVYSLTLPGSTFAALADGSATFSLALQGPVQNPVLSPPPAFVTDPSNGANLIFARLAVTTQAPTVVPEPSTLAMGGMGMLIALGYGWRNRKRAAA
jgi:hypothetical protein